MIRAWQLLTLRWLSGLTSCSTLACAVDPWQMLKVTSEPSREPHSGKPTGVAQAPGEHCNASEESTDQQACSPCLYRTQIGTVPSSKDSQDPYKPTHPYLVHAIQTNICYRLHLLRVQGIGISGLPGLAAVDVLAGSQGCWGAPGFQGVQDAAALREAGDGVLVPGARGSPGV